MPIETDRSSPELQRSAADYAAQPRTAGDGARPSIDPGRSPAPSESEPEDPSNAASLQRLASSPSQRKNGAGQCGLHYPLGRKSTYRFDFSRGDLKTDRP